MARRHQVTVLADLTVLRVTARACEAGCILRRRHRSRSIGIVARSTGSRARGGAIGNAHAAHPPPQLELLQLLLKELEVSLALAHLGVELGADGVIVRLLSHQVGSLDQSLLALDLLVDIHHLVFVGHGGGVVTARSVRAGVWSTRGCVLGAPALRRN